MNVFTALQFLQVNHQPLNQTNVVITDTDGKPDAILSELLADVMGKIAIFGNIKAAGSPEGIVDQLRMFTPLHDDVLDEYQKILEQDISGINFAPQKNLVEFIYQPLI